MIEQKHISNDRVESTDFELFVPCNVKPNNMAILRVYKSEAERKEEEHSGEKQSTKLTFQGVNNVTGEPVFRYENRE